MELGVFCKCCRQPLLKLPLCADPCSHTGAEEAADVLISPLVRIAEQALEIFTGVFVVVIVKKALDLNLPAVG